MIFVFGSNLSGIHGAGAARTAVNHFGAKFGVGEGLRGNSYALPTKGYQIEELPLTEIRIYVDRFVRFAREHPHLKFQVTRVGCGIGGKKDEDIAPMFYNAPDNCLFDKAWKRWLNPHSITWGTF